jgi:hypothetical protein
VCVCEDDAEFDYWPRFSGYGWWWSDFVGTYFMSRKQDMFVMSPIERHAEAQRYTHVQSTIADPLRVHAVLRSSFN